MNHTRTQAAALALSALMTFGVVAGMDGIAKTQYAAANTLAMAPYGQAHVALQTVTSVGHRANA